MTNTQRLLLNHRTVMRTLAILSLLIAVAGAAVAQASKSKNFYLFIGTYTNSEKTNGIHVYKFNAGTGDFSEQSKFTDIKNPSYLAVSKDKKNVYAVSEAGPGKGMNAFAFDMASGKLTYLNSASSGGGGPCYVSVDDKKRTVFAANYGSGSLGAIRLNADGSLTQDVQSIQHEGSGIDKERQSKPHVHSAVLSPDDRFLLVQDLGTDKVNVYRYQPENAQPLAPFDPPFAMVKAGGGRGRTFDSSRAELRWIQREVAEVAAAQRREDVPLLRSWIRANSSPTRRTQR